MKPVTMYEASDGSIHASEEKCAYHEQRIEDTALVNQYVEDIIKPVKGAAQQTIAREVLFDFLGWRASLSHQVDPQVGPMAGHEE